jgi:hypothetical protein
MSKQGNRWPIAGSLGFTVFLGVLVSGLLILGVTLVGTFAPLTFWMLTGYSFSGRDLPTHSPHDATPSIVKFFDAALATGGAFAENGNSQTHNCSRFRDLCYSTVDPKVYPNSDPTKVCTNIVSYAVALGAKEFRAADDVTATAIDGSNAVNKCLETLRDPVLTIDGKRRSANFKLLGQYKPVHTSFTVLIYRNEIASGSGAKSSYGMTVRTNEFE